VTYTEFKARLEVEAGLSLTRSVGESARMGRRGGRFARARL
jgi:hypothetical protein